MTMETFYLICFVVGLVLSLLSIAGGFTHLHLGRFHIGHTAHAHTHSGTHGLSSVNGFTITAFFCWFGGMVTLPAALILSPSKSSSETLRFALILPTMNEAVSQNLYLRCVPPLAGRPAM